MFRENITEPEILDSIDELVGRWAKEREASEGFGDFTVRAGIIRQYRSRQGFLGVTTRGNYVRTHLNALNDLPKVERILALAETNAHLEKLDAEGRVAWALEKPTGRVCALIKLWYSGGGQFASGESDPSGHTGDLCHRYRLPVPGGTSLSTS